MILLVDALTFVPDGSGCTAVVRALSSGYSNEGGPELTQEDALGDVAGNDLGQVDDLTHAEIDGNACE